MDLLCSDTANEEGGRVNTAAELLHAASKVSTAMAIRYLTAKMAQQVRKYKISSCVP